MDRRVKVLLWEKIWKASVFNTFPSTISVGPAFAWTYSLCWIIFPFFFKQNKIGNRYIYNINTTDLENKKTNERKYKFPLSFSQYILNVSHMLDQPRTLTPLSTLRGQSIQT